MSDRFYKIHREDGSVVEGRFNTSHIGNYNSAAREINDEVSRGARIETDNETFSLLQQQGMGLNTPKWW